MSIIQAARFVDKSTKKRQNQSVDIKIPQKLEMEIGKVEHDLDNNIKGEKLRQYLGLNDFNAPNNPMHKLQNHLTRQSFGAISKTPCHFYKELREKTRNFSAPVVKTFDL